MSLDKILSLNGVFAVKKPPGVSSASVVSRIKHLIISSSKCDASACAKVAKKLKVGHGGTLDPMATGILVIGLGEGCRRLSDFLKGPKTYEASAVFGVHYDTLDTTGTLLKRTPVEAIERRELEDACRKLTGCIMQKPPAFSAIRVNGKRAYTLARKKAKEAKADIVADEASMSAGRDGSLDILDLAPRPVNVYTLEVREITGNTALLKMQVGGGTYVRSLIRDLAASLNTIAAMSAICRTTQGVFDLNKNGLLEVEDCHNVDLVRKAVLDAENMLLLHEHQGVVPESA